MSGSPPIVTLNPTSIECNAGDTITVTVTPTDADSHTEVVHGTDELGVPVVVTSTATDSATVVRAAWSTSGDLARVQGLTVTGVAVYGAGGLEITVRDAEGNETTATCVVTVKPPTPAMLIGFTALPSDLATHAKMFPGAAYGRAYTQATKGITGWSAAAMQAMLAAGIEIHESFKDSPTSALLKPWFDAIPAAVKRVKLTIHHEPEGDLPIATYQADWATLRAFRDSHPNGHKVELVEDLTLYAEIHGKGPWSAWWSGKADKLAWDCYRNAIAGDSYPDPAVLFATPVAAWKATGVGWMVPEFGGDRISTDTTGAGRAAWMRACVAYAAAHGCEAIAWFCEPGTTSKAVDGYHLDKCPLELAAWAEMCTKQR